MQNVDCVTLKLSALILDILFALCWNHPERGDVGGWVVIRSDSYPANNGSETYVWLSLELKRSVSRPRDGNKCET